MDEKRTNEHAGHTPRVFFLQLVAGVLVEDLVEQLVAGVLVEDLVEQLVAGEQCAC